MVASRAEASKFQGIDTHVALLILATPRHHQNPGIPVSPFFTPRNLVPKCIILHAKKFGDTPPPGNLHMLMPLSFETVCGKRANKGSSSITRPVVGLLVSCREPSLLFLVVSQKFRIDVISNFASRLDSRRAMWVVTYLRARNANIGL